MDFNTYQNESRKKAIYPDIGDNFVFPTLGLVEETGEIAEKIKKLIRDKNVHLPSQLDLADKQEIQKEIGDVLWYLAQLSSECGLTLDEVAKMNLDKIASRHERNVVHGEGDNR